MVHFPCRGLHPTIPTSSRCSRPRRAILSKSARRDRLARRAPYARVVAANSDAAPVPDDFRRAAHELLSATWRPELVVEEIPAPQRIAPFAAAIAAEVIANEAEIGSGRLVLLHDPAGNAAWQGTFRCVSFARADIEPEMVTDPLLGSVGWSWLIDALNAHAADYLAPSGTVTSVSSESFGGMSDEAPQAEVEVRASWTPQLTGGAGLSAHVAAWAELLCTAAGLPPVPTGVVMMPSRRKPPTRNPRRR
jgi:hypothetical protein